MTIKSSNTGLKRLLFQKPELFEIGQEANFPYTTITQLGPIHGTRRVTELPNQRVAIEVSTCVHIIGHEQPLYTTEEFELYADQLNNPGFSFIGEGQGKKVSWSPSKERVG